MPGLRAGFDVLYEHLVEEIAEAGGTGTTLACVSTGRLRELVSKIKSGQHGNAQRIDGSALRGYCAHFAVDQRGQLANVVRVLTAQMVGLVIDADRGISGSALREFWPLPTSQFECIELGKQALDTLPNLCRVRHSRCGSPLAGS